MKLASIFQDHMVIQQGKTFRIWGTGEEGERICVTAGNERRETVTAQGRWELEFPPMNGGRKLEIRVGSEKEEKVIRDVVTGEVWLAGGQSNMEFQMLFDAEYAEEMERCGNEDLRFFDAPEISYEGQEEDFDYSQMGFWRKCTPEDLKYYSAAAYYFQKKLCRDLKVPVGIIGCNWGGTTAGCWMPEEDLKKHGQVWIDEYEKSIERIKDLRSYKEEFRKSPMNNRGLPFEDWFTMKMMPGVSREEQIRMMEGLKEGYDDAITSPFGPNRPGGLYHMMLEKVAGYSVKGVIWYQGESDECHAKIYKDVFLDMAQSWRNLWKENLPFITVQLAPFEAWLESDGKNFPEIRRQQRMAAREEKIYMVSSSDAGMRFDIHPKKKRPIGERLALMAEEKIYGLPVLGEAPEGVEADFSEEGLWIRFENAGEGLRLTGEQVNSLTVTDGNGSLVDILSAKAEQDRLYLRTKNRKNENCRISFAQDPYYEVNLYNSAGIPAIPFEIEVRKNKKK